ncbi:hypothetical protein CBER1_11351 [Cercospora berteroae]|uniref:C3H1-type domain-containing protein n=1 Tax=Cercospora berteroae TaxID=357750 RepID=A0A2S6BZ28_9PEZI|nr:hypothetical protein CBER1_11351 [Cercospora berteroae]
MTRTGSRIISVEFLLSEEFFVALLYHFMNTKSFALARSLAVAFNAAKLVADEKDNEHLIKIDGDDFQPVGHDGKPLLDMHNKPLSHKPDTNEAHNRERITKGGIGMLVYFWKRKHYTAVVSATGVDGFWINTFESFGGRGHDGVSPDFKQHFTSVTTEGHSLPEGAVAPPVPGWKPKVFFVRGRTFKKNTLLNGVPTYVRYKDLVAIAQGRLTGESRARLLDQLSWHYPTRIGDKLPESEVAEAEACRREGQPEEYERYEFENGRIVSKWSRKDKVSDEQHEGASLSICIYYNKGKCRDGKHCPRKHKCFTCGGNHRSYRCTKRTPMQAELMENSKRSREHAASEARTAQEKAMAAARLIRNPRTQPRHALESQKDKFQDRRGAATATSHTGRGHRDVPGLRSDKSGNTRAADYSPALQKVDQAFANARVGNTKRRDRDDDDLTGDTQVKRSRLGRAPTPRRR